MDKQMKETENKKGFAALLDRVLSCRNVGWLILKCALMFVVPYAYLFVCGFIDKALVSSGFAYRDAFILFVFFSLMLFWAIGAVLAVLAIIKFCKTKKNPK